MPFVFCLIFEIFFWNLIFFADFYFVSNISNPLNQAMSKNKTLYTTFLPIPSTLLDGVCLYIQRTDCNSTNRQFWWDRPVDKLNDFVDHFKDNYKKMIILHDTSCVINFPFVTNLIQLKTRDKIFQGFLCLPLVWNIIYQNMYSSSKIFESVWGIEPLFNILFKIKQ